MLVCRFQAAATRSQCISVPPSGMDRIRVSYVLVLAYLKLLLTLVVISGQLQIGDEEDSHDKHKTLIFSSAPGQDGVRLTRPGSSETEETRFVLIAGEPLDQPVVQVSGLLGSSLVLAKPAHIAQYGPFVVNTQEQAREAIMDYRGGKNGFEKVKGWSSRIGRSMAA